MSNFVQANEDDAYMYAKFQGFNIYRLLQLNTSRFDYYNFLQCNNAEKHIWSSLLQGSTKKDYKEIQFVLL
jgi:hypothetical protein